MNKIGITALVTVHMDRKVAATKTATRTPPSIAAVAMITTRTAHTIAPVKVRVPELLFMS